MWQYSSRLPEVPEFVQTLKAKLPISVYAFALEICPQTLKDHDVYVTSRSGCFRNHGHFMEFPKLVVQLTDSPLRHHYEVQHILMVSSSGSGHLSRALALVCPRRLAHASHRRGLYVHGDKAVLATFPAWGKPRACAQ